MQDSKNVSAVVLVAILFTSSSALSAPAKSPFELGIPASLTCSVLWDEDDGVFSRDALAEDGRIILRLPDSEMAKARLPEIAGNSIELDLDGLHGLPPGMTSEDTIVLGSRSGGGAVYVPYSLYQELAGCLPCPPLPTS